MRSTISFVLDGRIITEKFTTDVTPTTTVLNFLRTLPAHRGVKEGCAEGDCGACTVVLGELTNDNRIHYKAVDSCLLFLPIIHGKQLVTVENLQHDMKLHPIQSAMVETGGSQCGYCTPGIVMSLFSLYKNHNKPSRHEIDDALTGNLCRCTGYKPIVEAAASACVHEGRDTFTASEPKTVALLKSIACDSARFATSLQTYYQPKTLPEALAIKRQYPNATTICGATDIALRVTKKHELLDTILDLSAIDELKTIREEADSVRIGAAAVLNDIHSHIKRDFPSLSAMFNVFGSLQIRNLATLGGNLGSASPIGDTISALIPHNARVVLKNLSGIREVPLASYVTGYRTTVRAADELIVEVAIPKPKQQSLIKWYKVSKRKDLDISTVSGGFSLAFNESSQISSATLAYGGMADRVKCATTAETFLVGKAWTREVVEQAMPLIDEDFTPISDARGSAEFRRVAARNLLLKFWSETNNTQ